MPRLCPDRKVQKDLKARRVTPVLIQLSQDRPDRRVIPERKVIPERRVILEPTESKAKTDL